MWTGGNDISAERVWLWAGTGKALNFTRWSSYFETDVPEDDINREHCLQLYARSQYDWNDAVCDINYNFICEYQVI